MWSCDVSSLVKWNKCPCSSPADKADLFASVTRGKKEIMEIPRKFGEEGRVVCRRWNECPGIGLPWHPGDGLTLFLFNEIKLENNWQILLLSDTQVQFLTCDTTKFQIEFGEKKLNHYFSNRIIGLSYFLEVFSVRIWLLFCYKFGALKIPKPRQIFKIKRT